MIEIRKARDSDREMIWPIIQDVISQGDAYVFSPDSTREDMLKFWCGPDKHTFVAIDENQVVGTFFIKENQPGLGSHVANAGFMVSPNHSGMGIGKTMGEFALEEARRQGYSAMQFNFVVKSNESAVRLWKKLGFEIIGEIPDAFNHRQFGLTNAYIMYRKL